uniref:Ig-like domain-containing protein n=1 Tax=Callorhinchus milii TaxID=7868 RepID=A0A4W3I7N2_CALMI
VIGDIQPRFPVGGSHCYIVFAGLSLGALVTQRPRTVTAREGETVTLNCHQDDSSLTVMLWYIQPHQGGLTLIGYVVNSAITYEKSGHNITKTPDNMNSTLEISSINPTQDGVYYCAAREGQSVRETDLSYINLTQDTQPLDSIHTHTSPSHANTCPQSLQREIEVQGRSSHGSMSPTPHCSLCVSESGTNFVICVPDQYPGGAQIPCRRISLLYCLCRSVTGSFGDSEAADSHSQRGGDSEFEM